MSCTNRKIDHLRRQIPAFACVPGCHDCCGPVTASSEEMARLPVRSAAEHEAALARWDCVHLGPQGCRVYDQRPLICRLFGTTASLPCPRGRGPEQATAPALERQVHRLIASTRQLLV
ncbi:YkgJ family cysteine cluster protein [Pseudomonas lalucatii]|uniref:YkgJ family cysteine cluster protein n=1 Tax=Pseudomonas lalucatii TaxID=1424203 RepID=A0ABS5Q1K9_9PSED|nr:YkgJ family cysteine cluster protein [Pseudomonas lalucatii]MBS7662529.1 YkgJ family cysteine cluster protein [Pseudomonas lalucatii]MBS7690231.1 YkgJ family cysteine cluster protein [Pseudomonas lalucatii]MBS7725858.1 YkgJ family cysteine cluster protein [Pseudomonas lalucatii]